MTVQPVASVSHQMMPDYCALLSKVMCLPISNVTISYMRKQKNWLQRVFSSEDVSVPELSTDKVEKQKYGPASSLNFTAGEGDGRINIDTVSGRITLKHD